MKQERLWAVETESDYNEYVIKAFYISWLSASMVAPCSNICITKHLIWKEKREEIIKGWQSIPMNYHLNRNISYILPIIDLIKMKEKIQIAKMRAVLLYIMQCFPHGVEFIKLFKILESLSKA